MPRRAAIISLTPVTDEPRVLRQSRALAEQGWAVTVCGFAGQQKPPSWWSRFVAVDHVMTVPMLLTEPGELARCRQALRLGASRVSGAAAEAYYWNSAGYAGIYEQIATIDPVHCDLVLAHDYFTAPIAKKLAEQNEARFSIDIHEYARGQYMHDRTWRRRQRPWIDAMQRRFLPVADCLTTVCDGIADALFADYDLKARPTVVRSTAAYQELPFRATKPEEIDVLYHGIISPMRGLEETIRSVPSWKEGYRCLIRGPGPDDYVASLKALAAELQVENRVFIQPPVKADDMVREASKADIGFFIQPNISLQKRFALPNKFFEYVMAGLALCVADLPEMARLTKKHDLGLLVPESLAPQGIADTLHKMTPDRIDHYKKQSLQAARELCWEVEASHMLSLYDKMLPPSSVEAKGHIEPAPTKDAA